MKRLLLIVTACAAALLFSASLSLAQKPEKPKTPARPHARSKSSIPVALDPAKFGVSMKDLTSAEMYRYGREMYLSGNYMEATRVFLKMVRIDCTNKIARYHLRKIAAKDPSFAFLTEKLKALPCQVMDIDDEDFIPASFYYEKDPDIILDQLITYKNRQRLTDQEMNQRLEKYAAMVKDLESTVEQLKATQPAPVVPNLSNETAKQATIERIEAGQKTANKITKDIDYLKNQMASQRLEHQQEVQEMRTRLAAAEAAMANAEEMITTTVMTSDPSTNTPEPTPTVKPNAAPVYSPGAKALLAAIEKTKAELAKKEEGLQEKDKALSSLQERFNDIQARLKVIQDNLTKKNTQLQEIKTNLQDIEKP